MSKQLVARRWRRLLRRGFSRLPSLVEEAITFGTAAQIHELRVLIRRLRTILALGKGTLKSDSVAQFRAWSRTYSSLTNHVRDYDIVLEYLAPMAIAPAWITELRLTRQRHWRAFVRRAPRLPSQLLKALTPGRLNSADTLRVGKRYMKRIDRLQAQILQMAPKFSDANLEERHEIRRDVRRLRYLRELATPHRNQPFDLCLKLLLRTQEAMGEVQNCHTCEIAVGRLSKVPGARKSKIAITRQRTGWERACTRSLASLTDWLHHHTAENG